MLALVETSDDDPKVQLVGCMLLLIMLHVFGRMGSRTNPWDFISNELITIGI